MAKALLAAARGHHTDIVMCILKKDTSIMEQSIKDTPLFRQAMQDDLSCVFEVRLVSIILTYVRRRYDPMHYDILCSHVCPY